MINHRPDILIVGGGMGGVSAALSALRNGASVVLTEEYPWLGGQLTSQAVPLDEHTWIEETGATATYRQLRDGIREYYRRWYPLTEAARAQTHLNPGAGLVSAICHEPRVAVAVLEGMLAPYRSAGRLTVLQPAVPVAATAHGDQVFSVTVELREDGSRHTIEPRYVIDATELGDVLPLVGAEYVTGFESQKDTDEPSAPAEAQPENQQAFSWCFVLDHVDGNHVIDKPANYEMWTKMQPDFWGAPMISLTAPDPRSLTPYTRTFSPGLDDDVLASRADQRASGGDNELWKFRRIAARKLFVPGAYESDIVLVNWPMIDYLGGTLPDNPDAAKHLEASREQSLAMFYWLQTEAPRPDGGAGWPGLRLRGDVTGTTDGLAQAPYIRESRRIRALTTVREQDLSVAVRGHGRPAQWDDSVGVGMYRIDLHPTSGGDNYLDIASAPFEIPLGALIPQRLRNLLPAGKNIGTTHITNGAFRLHPVEWNIGESVGALAAHCITEGTEPHAVHADPTRREDFQRHLARQGVQLHWPDIAGY